MNRRIALAALAAACLLPGAARAELVKLDVLRREPYAGGVAFGDTGPYEVIVGVGRYAVDPAHARNLGIVDLAFAPRNAGGKVEFESDVYILAPKDPAKGNGAVMFDVHNRGNKRVVHFFNDAPGDNRPTDLASAGDGFLFRRGYTVVWCGWNGELLPGKDRLLLRVPIATDNGKPIRGVVRYETATDKPADSLPLARREGHGSYSPTEKGEREGVLTWRMREGDPRVPIPRAQWSIERVPSPEVKGGASAVLGQVRLKLAGGFRPGYLYELICECEGPIVQGLGYAAVRDLVSFLRHDGTAANPLRTAAGKSAITRAHAFGVSQSGRFLRNYLYLGFNADESNRKVFDGLIPHVAGAGLGFFNHRFAQPTRFTSQHEEHLYPIDLFPFAYGESTDPFTRKTDGILRRTTADDPKLLPKVMHTQGTGEYWHRSGSLVHTDPLGTKDADVPENVRVYTFGGTQHSPAADPPGRGVADNLLNPADYRPFLRALLDALDAWVRDGTAPPPSAYPRIDNGTLVPREKAGFPALPGVRYPEVIQNPAVLDYGPDFASKGIILVNPPRVGEKYTVRVPKCGPDGNELGTLLLPDVAVPLATYTGWNLRRRDVGAEGMLALLMGSYIPFPRTREERTATGDPRTSIAERYVSYEAYRKQYAAACDDLVAKKYFLREDADRLVKASERVRDVFTAAPPDLKYVTDAKGDTLAVVVPDGPLVHTGQVWAASTAATLDAVEDAIRKAGGDTGRIVKLNVAAATQADATAAREVIRKRYPASARPAVSFVVGKLPVPAVVAAIDAVAVGTKSVDPTARAAVLPAGPRAYISGQAEKGATPTEAAANTIASLVKTLEFLGAKAGDAVQAKCFLTPMSAAADVKKEFDKVFGPGKLSLVFVEWESTLPIEIELIARVPAGPAEGRPVEYLTPPGMTASPIYARVTRVHSPAVVYVAGLASPKAGTGAEEVAGVFEELTGVLGKTGSDLKHLAKATYYVSADDASKQLNALRPRYYDPKRPPAASKAQVPGVGAEGRTLAVDMIAVPKP